MEVSSLIQILIAHALFFHIIVIIFYEITLNIFIMHNNINIEEKRHQNRLMHNSYSCMHVVDAMYIVVYIPGEGSLENPSSEQFGGG